MDSSLQAEVKVAPFLQLVETEDAIGLEEGFVGLLLVLRLDFLGGSTGKNNPKAMLFYLPPEVMRKKKKAQTAPSLPSPSPSFASITVGGGAGEDHLTDLPNVVRLEILSLLPLKFAIRTGILCSRWPDLCKDRWPEPSSLDLSAADGELTEDFVDRYIQRRGQRPIDPLWIVFHPSFRHDHDVSCWLEYAASCGVKDLHVDISLPPLPLSTSSHYRPPRSRYGPTAAHFFYLGCVTGIGVAEDDGDPSRGEVGPGAFMGATRRRWRRADRF